MQQAIQEVPTVRATTRLTGTVRRMVREDRWGHIQTDDERQFFFHEKDLRGFGFDDLKCGRAVEFTPVDQTELRKTKPKARDRATNVRVIQ